MPPNSAFTCERAEKRRYFMSLHETNYLEVKNKEIL